MPNRASRPAPARSPRPAGSTSRSPSRKVLFLQVGTGTLFANNGTIDLIEFVVPAANVGDGNPVAATAGQR